MTPSIDSMELLNQISLFIGIWVAIYGIDSWRREHVGKRQLELAEDTLALFYEAADAIRHMRHPASFGEELAGVEREERESESQFYARQNASVVFHRYNQYQELFNKIHASRYRFMAQIGKGESKPFEDLRGIVNEIVAAARILSRLWARDHILTEEQRKKHEEQVDRYESVFWEGIQAEDPINPKLDDVIERIEATCNKVISGNGTLHGFINWKIGKDS